jgi:Domain of unknown function (DUF4301)
MNFNAADLALLQNKGIQLESLIQQLDRFIHQTTPIRLEKPCTPVDGIVVLTPTECHTYMELFEAQGRSKKIVKFVPASGAASRMFKHLHNYSPDNISELTEEFIIHFERFPFLDDLRAMMAQKGLDLDVCISRNEWNLIFDYILRPEGLFYDAQLKGMVLFHKHNDGARTAFEEHLHEAASYGKEVNGACRLHFTIAPQNLDLVQFFLAKKSEELPFEEFVIDYSVQEEYTDTLALTKDNTPLRNTQGELTFRPAGHGALIHNLQKIDADLIFIKNIDNVCHETHRKDSDFYKKVVGGLLVHLKSEVDHHLQQLRLQTPVALEAALEFIQQWFQPGLPIGMDRGALTNYAMHRLDRPLRVCGMVRNEGEPGGGPFWVKMTDGHISKQIVEKSQVDLSDLQQNKILTNATHFNPVDIVCSIKKADHTNYQLQDYIDHSTGFVSEKFLDGQVVQALELPGLWNGSMALWNTVFVEVPVSTFNPVKTVNDLLRPGHQQEA